MNADLRWPPFPERFDKTTRPYPRALAYRADGCSYAADHFRPFHDSGNRPPRSGLILTGMRVTKESDADRE